MEGVQGVELTLLNYLKCFSFARNQCERTLLRQSVHKCCNRNSTMHLFEFHKVSMGMLSKVWSDLQYNSQKKGLHDSHL